MKNRVHKFFMSLKAMLALCLTLVSLMFASQAFANNGVNLSDLAEVNKDMGGSRLIKEQKRMALNYVNQPPLIPHGTQNFSVTKNHNSCLQCHGVNKYRHTGAPRISPTHFVDASGKVLNNVAPNRYFCLQCHVSQNDAEPLVGNKFKPTDGFGSK